MEVAVRDLQDFSVRDEGLNCSPLEVGRGVENSCLRAWVCTDSDTVGT